MPSTYNAFKLVENGEVIEGEGVQKLIKFLVYYINYKTEANLKSAESLYQIFTDN